MVVQMAAYDVKQMRSAVRVYSDFTELRWEPKDGRRSEVDGGDQQDVPRRLCVRGVGDKSIGSRHEVLEKDEDFAGSCGKTCKEALCMIPRRQAVVGNEQRWRVRDEVQVGECAPVPLRRHLRATSAVCIREQPVLRLLACDTRLLINNHAPAMSCPQSRLSFSFARNPISVITIDTTACGPVHLQSF